MKKENLKNEHTNIIVVRDQVWRIHKYYYDKIYIILCVVGYIIDRIQHDMDVDRNIQYIEILWIWSRIMMGQELQVSTIIYSHLSMNYNYITYRRRSYMNIKIKYEWSYIIKKGYWLLCMR